MIKFFLLLVVYVGPLLHLRLVKVLEGFRLEDEV